MENLQIEKDNLETQATNFISLQQKLDAKIKEDEYRQKQVMMQIKQGVQEIAAYVDVPGHQELTTQNQLKSIAEKMKLEIAESGIKFSLLRSLKREIEKLTYTQQKLQYKLQ